MDEIQDRANVGATTEGAADPNPHAVGPEMSDVQEQRGNNGERSLGGITGKGFLPGRSGNPGGRPKDQSLAALIREFLEQDTIGDKKLSGGKRVKDLLVESLVKAALKGDIRHLQEVLNRTDGKLTERVEHTGWGGGPIEVDATVCVLSAEQVDAWRQQKRAEISARPTGPPP